MGFDLNLEFIKVHFMVFIMPSLNHLCDNWGKLVNFCVFQFSYLKLQIGWLRIKWVTRSNMLRTIPGTLVP